MGSGEAPSGFIDGLIKFYIKLLLLKLFQVADVFADDLFIQTDCADTIACRPEEQTRNPFYLQNLSMDSYGAFSFQKPDYEGKAELRRHAQTHMDMVWH